MRSRSTRSATGRLAPSRAVASATASTTRITLTATDGGGPRRRRRPRPPRLDVLVDGADLADVAADRLDGGLEFGDAVLEVVEAVPPLYRLFRR
ncbi:hypothetical protein BRD07_00100 [Halobacteriales archaeon QS_9_68_42]|nr:MAG: hypothetical protein BRD07_00100 [Halobacteriales archaeon QS_9_68_42]